MERVGVRELKNRATQIVRAVREDHAEYLVTVDGEPVAVLRPCEERDLLADKTAKYQASLQRIKAIAAEIGAAWRSPKGAVELLMDMRAEEHGG
jgi:prevent-host-death family protein